MPQTDNDQKEKSSNNIKVGLVDADLLCKGTRHPNLVLLKLAEEMMEAEKQGNALGLSKEEKAFYDALTRPQAVKDFYTNEQLVALTKELTDMLRKNRTIDWNRRESERANMRRLVKRLLKQYKYPPEEAEDAMNVVLKQCEQWVDVEEHESYSEAPVIKYDFTKQPAKMVAQSEE